MPAEKARSDQHGFPLWPLAAAFTISMLAVAAMILMLWQLQHRFADLRAKQVELSEYHSRVMLYDEALTMAARMAAATGDSHTSNDTTIRWRARRPDQANGKRVANTRGTAIHRRNRPGESQARRD